MQPLLDPVSFWDVQNIKHLEFHVSSVGRRLVRRLLVNSPSLPSGLVSLFVLTTSRIGKLIAV